MSFVDRPWAGASKVHTSERDKYEQIVDPKDPHKFNRLYDAFHAAAALGIRLDSRRTDPGKRDELMNVYSVDPEGILWAVMSAKYPQASGQQRFELLMAHADWGIERLADQFALFGELQSAIDSTLA